MIRYELKDKKRQTQLLTVFPDFLEALTHAVNNRKANEKFVKVSSGYYEYSINVYFEEVEGHEEYDPNNWNEYPAVKPPEGVKMRIEYFQGNWDYTGGLLAVFSKGEWHTSDVDGKAWSTIANENVKRFRPWDDNVKPTEWVAP